MLGINSSAMPNIVLNNLQCWVDAADKRSYSGSGTTWFDLSGNGKNFSFTNSPTFNTDAGGCLVFNGTSNYLTGAASNTYGITGDHTIEIVLKPTQNVGGATFKFSQTGVCNSRGIFSHTPYIDGYYYDTGGCGVPDSRIFFTDGALINTYCYFFFRRRSSVTPYRQIFRNGVVRANSGSAINTTITLNSTGVLLGADPASSEYFKGNIYLMRVYNTALTDTQISQNYNYTRRRFGL